ncbi:MAG: nitroreductase family protein, partial [Pseudomonadota bacterium]
PREDFLMIKDLVYRSRSYRRFYKDAAVSMETLRELVDLARHSASAGNLQPLKYVLSCEAATNTLIFQHLAWAAYLKDWPGPVEGERPGAYIIILGDTSISKTPSVDHGIACQSMLMGAVEKGLGGCIIGSIKRDGLRQALEIPDHCEILLVLALGKPKEQVKVEYIDREGDIKYWRDAQGVHHVPKRRLEDLIVRQFT